MRMVILALVSMTLFTGDSSSADKPKEKDLSRLNNLMAEKLKNSQLLLEGLALNDFDKITKSGEELMRISKQAEWSAFKTPQYEMHTNSFRRSVETLLKKSKEKNLDGATLAYLDITVTCVRCHQHTREVRDTSLFSREE